MSNQSRGDVICDSSNWSVLNYNCAFADKGLANHSRIGQLEKQGAGNGTGTGTGTGGGSGTGAIPNN